MYTTLYVILGIVFVGALLAYFYLSCDTVKKFGVNDPK